MFFFYLRSGEKAEESRSSAFPSDFLLPALAASELFLAVVLECARLLFH